jgi:hypothetical protein
MAIMHPNMYVTGRKALVQLGGWAKRERDGDILEVLPTWPSVYSIASVMVNWVSPFHLDIQGRPQWLDLLVSVGDHEELDMVLPTIGLRLRYNPGSVLAMSGQLIKHGVSPISGNRGVVSFYMRDNVHDHMDVVRCNYVHVDHVPKYQ